MTDRGKKYLRLSNKSFNKQTNLQKNKKTNKQTNIQTNKQTLVTHKKNTMLSDTINPNNETSIMIMSILLFRKRGEGGLSLQHLKNDST